MSWTIRRMIAVDVDSVLKIAEEIPEAPHWNHKAYESFIESEIDTGLQRVGFVAESQGRLLGFSIGKLVAGVCELESIAVLSTERGRGIGRALLYAFIQWANAHQAVRLELEVRASNSGTIRLYEFFELRREGVRKNYYHSPEEDAVLMGTALPVSGKLT